MNHDLEALTQQLRDFAKARDWGQFHSPKNLASALTVEAAELLEHFQWMTEDQSRHLSEVKRGEISAEVADVFLYILQLCDGLGIDLVEAASTKIASNAAKYPVELARGNSKKYSEF